MKYIILQFKYRKTINFFSEYLWNASFTYYYTHTNALPLLFHGTFNLFVLYFLWITLNFLSWEVIILNLLRSGKKANSRHFLDPTFTLENRRNYNSRQSPGKSMEQPARFPVGKRNWNLYKNRSAFHVQKRSRMYASLCCLRTTER